MIVTRFAPSPTGYLHIGGARTALFNHLFARGRDGRFLLRIEDTDRARSTQDAIDKILDGLRWLGLDWDGDIIFQSERADRHRAAAQSLLETGGAYRCYATPEELDAIRTAQRAAGEPTRYDGRWRDRADAPADAPYVIRLRAPQEGETVIADGVQGDVSVANKQLDDMVLLRADGAPTYMLAVVVDDHDMGVTDVIRGDDHLTNAFRQTQLYHALGWAPPRFAHIPLIHGADGAKLSKRHGAVGLEQYRDMGYLPEALRNHLLRLGWGHGDDEIISDAQARQWFGLDGVGRGAARFDTQKLDSLNQHYLKDAHEEALIPALMTRLRDQLGDALAPEAETRLRAGLPGLRPRAKTLNEMAEQAVVYGASRPIPRDADAEKMLAKAESTPFAFLDALGDTPWTAAALEQAARDFCTAQDVKLGPLAQPLRAALAGRKVSPPVFDMMAALGPEETRARLTDALPELG